MAEADVIADILTAYGRFSVQWESPRATQFRCGDNVRQYLWDRYVVPYRMKLTAVPPPAVGDALFGIPIVVDDTMEPRAWRVLDHHGNVMGEGSIA